MGNRQTITNVLLIGHVFSGKSYLLNKLSEGIYLSQPSDTVQFSLDKLNRFIFREHQLDRLSNHEYDILMVMVDSNASLELLHDSLNRMLKMYMHRNTPICIIYNKKNENDDYTYNEKNEILLKKNFANVLTCDLKFKDKEWVSRLQEILKWIILVNSAKDI